MRRVIEITDEKEVTEHFFGDDGGYTFRRLSEDEAKQYIIPLTLPLPTGCC